MRLAIVSHTYVVHANRGKLEELVKAGVGEVLLIVPEKWVNRDIGNVIRTDETTGEHYQTKTIRSWLAGFGSLSFYSPHGLFNALRSFRPDMIYIEEEPWSLVALQLCVLSVILGARFVFFTWDNIGNAYGKPQGLIRRISCRRASGIIAGNSEARELVLRSGIKRPTAVIPQLGVDPREFSPRSVPESAGGGFVVGYVGRLVTQKGVAILLEAVARLEGVSLLLVGQGPLLTSLRSRSEHLGLSKRICFSGGVSHESIPSFMRQMDVLVLPSLTTGRWKEQFGHVLVEAMACGIPVVGSDSGAIPEVVDQAGIIVAQGSIDELASALRSLKDQPDLRAELSKKGLARVHQRYTNSVVAHHLAAFLKALQ